VPDNGTPGKKAPADQQIQNNNNNVTNNWYWYSSTTNANSARDPGMSGDNPYDGHDDGSGVSGGGVGACSGSACGEGEGSASGGEGCDAPPVCVGDAIQCALLAQEWRQRCPQEWNGGFDEFGEQIGLPNEGDEGGSLPESTLNLPEALDDAGWLGGGQCLDDMHIELQGWGTISVPLSEWCWVFQMIGMGVMICAYISGARILFGS
jgi:hypothetical protein